MPPNDTISYHPTPPTSPNIASLALMERPGQDDRVPRKPKTERRHGSCNPCKLSKTKCDGQQPCGACRKEKRKPRGCEYSSRAKALIAARKENENKRVSRCQSPSDQSENSDYNNQQPSALSIPLQPSSPTERSSYVSVASTLMHQDISLLGVVDEFIKLQSVKGQAAHHIRRVQDHWTAFQASLTDSDPAINLHTTIFEGLDHQATHFDDASNSSNIWKAQLKQINDQVSRGNLLTAFSSIPYLLRAIEAYELRRATSLNAEAQQKITQTYIDLLQLEPILCFFLGVQSFLPAWKRSKYTSRKIHRYSVENEYLESRLDLFQYLQDLLEIDTSSENGVWRFLEFVTKIKSAVTATSLDKMAISVNDPNSFEEQELRVLSNLVFLVMYCRTASVCGHYSQDACQLRPRDAGPWDVIYQLKLTTPRQKGAECTQVIKHAGNILDAFNTLCGIEKDRVARSWSLIYGALIAAVLKAVWGLRGKSSDWDDTKTTLDGLQKNFVDLKEINEACPILENAITVLEHCDQRQTSSTFVPIKRSAVLVREDRPSAMGECDSGDGLPFFADTRPKKEALYPQRKRSLDEAEGLSLPPQVKVRRTEKQEAPKVRPASLTTGEQHNDVISQPTFRSGQHPFTELIPTYDNDAAMQAEFNASFGSNATTLPTSFPSSTATSFADIGPQTSTWPVTSNQFTFYSPANEGWLAFNPIHPPLTFPDAATVWYHPPLVPFYTGYDESANRLRADIAGQPPSYADGIRTAQDAQAFALAQQGQVAPTPLHQPDDQTGQRTPASALGNNGFFYNMTARHFEGCKTEEAPPESGMSRRPSNAVNATTMPQEGLKQEDSLQYFDPSNYNLQQLPPRPESVCQQPHYQLGQPLGLYHGPQGTLYHDGHMFNYGPVNTSVQQ